MRKIILVTFSLILFTVLTGDIYGGLEDRAFATHNINKVGFFTTNIGQFYPYGGQFEQTMEYPINSGHISIYRQCLMIGVPVNVISAASGRFEEFSALGGYHNPDSNKIAISDDPTSWPRDESGEPYWPVRNEEDQPVFLSQQESFCAYSDSTNWRYYYNDEPDMLLNMRVFQTIYTWGVPGADKFHILRFVIRNAGDQAYEDLYFNMYSDIDIGGIAGDPGEWTDDCIQFDKERELLYFYDSDNYSDEWGEENPFPTGVTFLETPNDLGITDWHWIDVNIDEVSVSSTHWDSVSYYLMSSDTSYFHDHPDLDVSDYFHLGENPSNGTHFDDPATTRITDDQGNVVGGPMVAYISSGPYRVEPGEEIELLLGVMVGDTEEDLIAVTDQIWEYYRDDFRIPVVPEPRLQAETGDSEARLFWSDSLDVTYTNPVKGDSVNDLEGYRLYRTTDQALRQWDLVADIPMRNKDNAEITGDAYEYVDTDVSNGMKYFYNLSAYRTRTDGEVEESIRLADINSLAKRVNATAVTPHTGPAETGADMENIKVVPNPYVVSAAWDNERLGSVAYGEPIRKIAFTHLPRTCTIKIFTVDGDLVQTLHHNDTSGREEWNLLTSENRPVVSGMYFYHVESDLGEKIGRFAIIR